MRPWKRITGWKNGTANNINGYGLPTIHQTVRQTTHDRPTAAAAYIYTHVTVWNVVALGICASVERYGEDGNGEQLQTADEPTD